MKNETTKEFLKIVAENPDLPIVCMVDCDVVYEDYGRWLASFGAVYVGEYALYDDRYYDERDEFKEAYYDNNDEELCEMFGYCPWEKQNEANSKAEQALEKHLDEVAEKHFIKAIIVNIDLPDFVL